MPDPRIPQEAKEAAERATPYGSAAVEAEYSLLREAFLDEALDALETVRGRHYEAQQVLREKLGRG